MADTLGTCPLSILTSVGFIYRTKLDVRLGLTPDTSGTCPLSILTFVGFVCRMKLDVSLDMKGLYRSPKGWWIRSYNLFVVIFYLTLKAEGDIEGDSPSWLGLR